MSTLHSAHQAAIHQLARPSSQAGGPLTGIRVVDISRVMSGNMLTLQLADLGAEVIKVEEPGRGDELRGWFTGGVPIWWRVYSRNKRSLTLRLRDPRGLAVLRKLIGSAHVLVENFRPGTLEAMGLGAEVLLELQPKLVIARISGWGQTGPYRKKPGFGTLVEAYSGMAAKTGFEDRPPVLPNLSLADMITGLYGFGAVLAGLRAAEGPDGLGQVIDLSLFDAMLSCVGPDSASVALTDTLPLRQGSRSTTAAPRNVYRTADDEWVALSAPTQAMVTRLYQAIGHPDMIGDARFSTHSARLENVELLDEVIGAFIGKRRLEEVLTHFDEAEVTVGPVMTAGSLLSDRFVRERESLVAMPDPDVGLLPMHNVVPRFSRTPGVMRPAPKLGQDTNDVLASLGLSPAERQELAEGGVI